MHDDPVLLICVAAAIHRRYRERAAGINGQLPGYERTVANDWVVLMMGVPHPVTVRPIEGGHEVTYAGESHRVVSDWQFGQPIFRGQLDDRDVCIQVERIDLNYRLTHWGYAASASAFRATWEAASPSSRR